MAKSFALAAKHCRRVALFQFAERGVTVIDGLPLLPHHRRFTTDGLHPNDLGMLHLAHALAAHNRSLCAAYWFGHHERHEVETFLRNALTNG